MKIDYKDLDSPGLLVFPERVAHNIDWAIQAVHGDASRLRPHIKTHKTKEVNEMMLERGITKFKAATIAEAELLAMSQAPDVLLAMQATGPYIARLLQLIRSYPQTRFSCLLDHPEALEPLGSEAEKAGLSLGIFLDLDMGMHRTGIPIPHAMAMAQEIHKAKGLEFRGLQAYDGHIRDQDLQDRKARAEQDFKDFWDLKKALEIQFKDLECIVGGTPSFLVHKEHPGITCSPGTFVFFDAGYAALYPQHSLQQAVYVLGRVISKPGPQRLCLDLGHKSVAAENPIENRLVFLDPRIKSLLSQSEEHGIVAVDRVEDFKIGDPVLAIPYHVCPTVALHQSLQVIKEGGKVGEWNVLARNRKISI